MRDLTKLSAKALGKAFEANEQEHSALITACIDAGWGHLSNSEIIAKPDCALAARLLAAVNMSIAIQAERQRRRDWGLPLPA